MTIRYQHCEPKINHTLHRACTTLLALTLCLPALAQRGNAACIGDCDGSGDVTVNELITMVNIALDSAPLSNCTVGDADGSGDITVNEIIEAVNNALAACPAELPSPTPTATATATLPEATQTPTFSTASTFPQIQATILAPTCLDLSCHNAKDQAGSLVLEGSAAYANLVGVTPSNFAASQAGMLRVDPGNPANSFLITKLTLPSVFDLQFGSRMPSGKPVLSAEQIDDITAWILRGALADESAPPPTPTPMPTAVIRQVGSLPDPSLPEGTDTLPQIEHVIILMMENHSFDNYFGVLDPSVGLPVTNGVPSVTNPDGQGNLIHAFHMPSACQLNDHPGQDWNASHISYADGRNDGFVLASGPVAMGYWTGGDLPFYYGLARTFPLASRWFSSTLCQTYPNRRFLMAGTAAGIISTTTAALAAPPPPNGNIFDRLDAHGIAWRNYYSDVPSVFILSKYAQQHFSNLVPIAKFFTDAAAGTLPPVSVVDPLFNKGGSEENPDDIRIGEQFSSQVINAVMSSPNWPSTLLVWLYDEHGGYYDHVPPPPAIAPDDIPPDLGAGDVPGGYDQYGFRVPAVVVSPYARPNYVSSIVRDHTAVLKFIERKWNIGALTLRDANADDLFDCLDFTNPPAFLNPPTLPPPALAAANPPACTPGDPGTIPPPDAVTPALSAIHADTRTLNGSAAAETPMGQPLAQVWAQVRSVVPESR